MENQHRIVTYWLDKAKDFQQPCEKVDLLTLAGLARSERVYSKVLYSFLSLKTENKLFDNFIEFVSTKLSFFTPGRAEHYEVFREYNTPSGIVDLLIRSKDKAIVIENKIDAGDQPNQLTRYYDYFNERYKTFILYLTPHGYDPSAISIRITKFNRLKEEGKLACISYNEILSWLENSLVCITDRNIESAIIQFCQTIRGMLNMNEEVMKIVREEYQNTSINDVTIMKQLSEALEIIQYAKRTVLFFSGLMGKLRDKFPTETDRLFYVCNENVFTDFKTWESSVVDEGCKFYGITVSYGLSLEPKRPLYGIRIASEGNVEGRYRNKTYFGIIKGKEQTNPLNLGIDNYEADELFWGQHRDVTYYVDDQNYDFIINLFSDAIKKNNEITGISQ